MLLRLLAGYDDTLLTDQFHIALSSQAWVVFICGQPMLAGQCKTLLFGSRCIVKRTTATLKASMNLL